MRVQAQTESRLQSQEGEKIPAPPIESYFRQSRNILRADPRQQFQSDVESANPTLRLQAESRRLSVSNCLNKAKAIRTQSRANGDFFVRLVARASIRLAMLAHAISKTQPNGTSKRATPDAHLPPYARLGDQDRAIRQRCLGILFCERSRNDSHFGAGLIKTRSRL